MDLAPRAHPLETALRPARVLLAWLEDDLAHWALHQGPPQVADGDPEDRLGRARRALDGRPRFRTNLDAVRALPPSLAPRAAAAREVDGSPVEVRLVDLARLIAVQPYAFTDTPVDPTVTGADPDGLFDVSLPGASTTDVAIGFDRPASQFVVASRNQNLQVVGEFSGPIPDAPAGSLAVGFLVAAPPSWVRVAILGDRALLLDGYHRAVALLGLGIRDVPAAVEVTAAPASLFTEGMLGDDVFLGPRPPTVADYLDDTVATSATLPHVGRAVTITAAETDLRGAGPPRRA